MMKQEGAESSQEPMEQEKEKEEEGDLDELTIKLHSYKVTEQLKKEQIISLLL